MKKKCESRTNDRNLDIFSLSHQFPVHSFPLRPIMKMCFTLFGFRNVFLLCTYLHSFDVCWIFLLVCIILVYSFCSVALQLIYGNNRIQWIVVSSSSSGTSVALFTFILCKYMFFSACCTLNCDHLKLWCAWCTWAELKWMFGVWFSLARFSTIIPELITNIIVWLNELELMEYCTKQQQQQMQQQYQYTQNNNNNNKRKKYKTAKNELRLYGSKGPISTGSRTRHTVHLLKNRNGSDFRIFSEMNTKHTHTLKSTLIAFSSDGFGEALDSRHWTRATIEHFQCLGSLFISLVHSMLVCLCFLYLFFIQAVLLLLLIRC